MIKNRSLSRTGNNREPKIEACGRKLASEADDSHLQLCSTSTRNLEPARKMEGTGLPNYPQFLVEVEGELILDQHQAADSLLLPSKRKYLQECCLFFFASQRGKMKNKDLKNKKKQVELLALT